MKKEMKDRLAEEFEFLKRKPSHEYGDWFLKLYPIYGAELGDGWYQLLYDMCKEIVEVFKAAEKPVNIVMDQITEKLGILRVCYHFEEEGTGNQEFDYTGSGSIGISPQEDDMHKEISRIVKRYQEKSWTVCDVCGREGILRKDLRWISTLCDNCYLDRLKRQTESQERYEKMKTDLPREWHSCRDKA